jgi:hypothetical protein
MLRTIKDLENYTIRATDGDIGRITDFYFDDLNWVIRYLVVDTGTWLSGRKVLITSNSLSRPDWIKKVLPIFITKAQVKNSPNLDAVEPISRQHELQFLKYYGNPHYWGASGLSVEDSSSPNSKKKTNGLISGLRRLPTEKDKPHAARAKDEESQSEGGSLRSCEEIMEYHIEAIDGDIGHVGSLLVDEETWAIRYLIVDTSEWWVGHQVLVAPSWINGVRWVNDSVSVNLTRQAVKDAPPYDSAFQLGREGELAVHKHHGRTGYWASEVERVEVLSPD